MNPTMKIDHTWTVTVERPGREWTDIRKQYTTQFFRPAWVRAEIRKDGHDGVLRLQRVQAGGQRVLKNGLSDITLVDHFYVEGDGTEPTVRYAPDWLSAVVAEVFAYIGGLPDEWIPSTDCGGGVCTTAGGQCDACRNAGSEG